MTLETLGQRWGWEKTKVWRFFQKHGDVFALYRLPGAYGCLIFNKLYPTGTEVSLPTQDAVARILARNTRKVNYTYIKNSIPAVAEALGAEGFNTRLNDARNRGAFVMDASTMELDRLLSRSQNLAKRNGKGGGK